MIMDKYRIWQLYSEIVSEHISPPDFFFSYFFSWHGLAKFLLKILVSIHLGLMFHLQRNQAIDCKICERVKNTFASKRFSVMIQASDLHLYLKCHSSTVVLHTFCYSKSTAQFLYKGLFILEKLSRLGGKIIPVRSRHNANHHLQKSSIHMS